MKYQAQRGFTLVEMMIALLLGLLIVGGVVAVFLSNKQSYTTNAALGQVQDSSRTAFELLSRDIRETGLTGCGNAGRVGNVLNNGPVAGGTAWYADIANTIHGYDGGTADPAVNNAASSANVGKRWNNASSSSIQLVGADGVGVSIATHDTAASKITLNETSSPISAGDIVVICDPDHAVIAQTTSVAAGPPIALTLATGVGVGNPGNCSVGFGLPTLCTAGGNPYQYAANSQIAKLYAVDWYIGYNNLGTTSLYRSTLVNTGGVPTATAQEMVRNVTRMLITYHVQNTPTFVSASSVGAANWATVDAVLIMLDLISTNQHAATTQALTAPIKRTIPITITLRNRMQ